VATMKATESSLMETRNPPSIIRVARWSIFQTKNPNLGNVWRALERKMLAYFFAHLEYITAFWYILC
jgi:hypothetical protein